MPGETATIAGESLSTHGQPDAAASGPSETYGITCPDCGGSLRLHEGEKSIRCEYCGSALHVMIPMGVKRFILPPVISAGKAKLQALYFLSEQTGGKIKARHASIVDLKLINVPFWRMRGRLAGWVCGERIIKKQVEIPAPGPRGSQVRYKTVEERIPFAKLIYKRVGWSTPACSLRHLGLQGISLKTRFLNWDIFDHGLKKTLNIALPMKTGKKAERDAFRYLSTLATPGSSTVRANRFHMFDNDFSLYYYPVYILRYKHSRIIYSITIDGNDGNVIRGNFPTREPVDYKSMFFVPAITAFLAGTWAPLVLIAALVIYLSDMITSGRLVPPHRWLMERLGGWFGRKQ